MPIKAIDIAKTPEVSVIKQAELNKAQSTQNQINNQFQHQVHQKARQTNNVAEKDNPEYRYDAKEKGNNEYHGSKKKKQKKDSPKKSVKENKPIKPGGFDIYI